MKKKTKSPLEKQAQKRFLRQITGLDLDEKGYPIKKSKFHEALKKIKQIF